ncbi:DEG1A [Auxenochlorella protothecoides x Auxenochlorella symbiontica]|uniref:PDZ domain-containing protein n=1 Tax=Auxenochlorella protothecoides TaxID=3075 RepID=A0A1D2A8W8_AUXPR
MVPTSLAHQAVPLSHGRPRPRGPHSSPCGRPARGRADRLQAVPRASSDGQGSALSHLLQHGIAGLASLALLGSPALAPPASQATTFLTSDETSTVNLFQASKPGVVYITNLASRRDTFTLNMLEVPQGAGSGMVWDAQGHIVTNYHVIRGASEVLVTMTGGEDYPATVVGVDQDRDVAVLQLQGLPAEKSVTPLKIGSSANLKVGQRVFAIGNPFGLDHTLTTGVISGTGREIPGATGRPIQDVIQTDAAINPGNSGGPLLDSGGELIGVNTAIYSPSGANSGVGFAIPVDIVRSSVDQIVRFGRVTRPMLGIAFAPEQSAEQLGVRGVLVLDARKGSPADEAGIKGTSRDEYGRLVLGDIIISIDGARVKTGSDLFRALDKRSVGDALDVEVLRGNDRSHVAITLAASNT